MFTIPKRGQTAAGLAEKIRTAASGTPALVTVVVPTFNQGAYVREAVESILAQTHAHLELIIVDDGSTDGTAEYLQTISDPRVTVLQKENGGTGSALNAGFARARGKYETWWASDNVMYPQMLERLVAGLEGPAPADYAYGECLIRDWRGGECVAERHLRDEVGSMEWNPTRLRNHYFLGICWLWRCSLRDKAGSEFQKEPCEDYDMLLRMVEANGTFRYVHEVLGWFRRHRENMSNRIRREHSPGHFTRLVLEKAEKRKVNRTKAGAMKILHINLEFDCAGVSWNLCRAINEHTKHSAKHACLRPTFAAPDTDVRFTTVDELLPLCEDADVLHFNQWIWTHRPGRKAGLFESRNEYGEGNPFSEVLRRKRVIYHMHGGPHQLKPAYWVNECARVGATMLKCDPIAPIPGATWIPNVLDVPAGVRVLENVRPSVALFGDETDIRRNNKQIMQAFDYAEIPYRAFNAMPRAEAFRARKEHSITVDNLTQGFVGMWTWEAIQMGVVPVARIAPTAMAEYARAFGSPPPIVTAENVDTMVDAIFQLMALPSTAPRSVELRNWAERCLSPARLAEQYINLYAGNP